MSEIADLVERLEKATEGKRDLDALVAIQVGVNPGYQGDGVWDCPRYSSSIDAALTLVPEGCDWDIGRLRENGFVSAHVMWLAPAGNRFTELMETTPDTIINWGVGGRAPTPAIALTIAALRARLQAQ